MALELKWVGTQDYPRVAQTRLRCYAASSGMAAKYDASVTADGRQRPGDFLLATRDGVDVGTTTALSLNMWIRGARVPCQGVAYVGTIKTHRRGGAGDERGVASTVMTETLKKARERGEIVSALMPFRASFYEHFGFGNAELRTEWTVPLAILPRGEFNGYRFYEKADDAKLLELRAREAQAGQCDVETDQHALANFQRAWDDGMVFVDQPTAGGPIEAWVRIIEERGPVTAIAVVDDWAAESPASLRRMLHFLASLKDQYSLTRINLPGSLPLNRLLRETQIPHRQVDHPVAVSRPYTRMQIRVLDHKALLEAMTLGASASGSVGILIRECEGTASRFTLHFDGNRMHVSPVNGDAEVEMSDVLWASIISGDLRASTARDAGLIRATSPTALALLDALAAGPVPFCQEYF